jgi:WD40 repeat protein
MRYKSVVAAAVLIGVSFLFGADPPAKPAPIAATQPRLDSESVPLPAEALARLGSSRMRLGSAVESVATSPDGRTIVSADAHAIVAWDATTGKRNWSARTASDDLSRYVGTVGFGDNGRAVLCLGAWPTGSFRRFDAANGRETARFEANPTGFRCFSNDGKLFAYGHRDKTFRVCNAITGREIQRVGGLSGYLRDMDFSGDNRTLAVVDGSATARLFAVASGEQVGEFTLHDAALQKVALAPDGKTLAGMDRDQGFSHSTVHLWNVATGRYIGQLEGEHGRRVFAIGFSPDGKTIVTGNQLTDTALWNAQTCEEIRSFTGPQGVISVAFSKDSKTIVAGTNLGVIVQWDVATGHRLPASADPETSVVDVRFVDGGRKVLGRTNRFVVWDVATGAVEKRYADVPNAQWSAALSPDGRLLAAPVKGSIGLRNADDGTEIRELTTGGEMVPSVIPPLFTPDGRKLITGSRNRAIVWNVSSGEDVGTAHCQGFVTALVGSPNGKLFATLSSDGWAGGDNSVRVWDCATLKEVGHWGFTRGTLLAASFSPDSRYLVAAGGVRKPIQRTGEGQIWEISSGKEVKSFSVPKLLIFSVAVSPDGRSFATGSSDATVRIWETATGAERHCFSGHDGVVESVAFSPDGRTLASSSSDAPVYLWDLYGRSDPRPPAIADELKQYWTDLAGADAAVAFQAIRRLINAYDGVAFLRERLKPAPAVDAANVNAWIAQLDNPRFAERQAAAKELEPIVDRVSEQLRAALAESKSAEVRRALQALLDRLDTNTPEMLRSLRAVEVLEQIATPAAREHVKSLAGGADGATLTRAAAEALKRSPK